MSEAADPQQSDDEVTAAAWAAIEQAGKLGLPGGKDYLVTVARERPAVFLKVLELGFSGAELAALLGIPQDALKGKH